MRVFPLEHGYELRGNTTTVAEHTAYAHGNGTLDYQLHKPETHARWTSVKAESDTVLAKNARSLKSKTPSGSGFDASTWHTWSSNASSTVPATRSSLSYILNLPAEDAIPPIEAPTDARVRRESDARSISAGSSITTKPSKNKRGRAQSDDNTCTRSSETARELKRQKESDAREKHARLYGGLEKVLVGDLGVVYERAGYNAMNSHNQGEHKLMLYSKEGTLVCATTKLKEFAVFLPLMKELALSSMQLQQAIHALGRHPHKNQKLLDTITQSFKLTQREYEQHLHCCDPKGELDIARAEDLRDHFQSLAQSLRRAQDG
jgi:hypothetical protein